MKSLRETISSITEPSFITELKTISTDELRKRRDMASAAESLVSYVRRLVQAKIDIEVAAEGAASSTDLLSNMTAILSGSAIHSSTGRLVEVDITEDQVKVAEEYLTEILSNTEPPVLEVLKNAENELSQTRRELHQIIDQLGTELVERYRTGKATVDGLLEDVSQH